MLFSSAPVVSAMKNPNPIAFSLFGLQFYWYGILMAIGVILAFLLADAEVKRKKLHPDTAFDMCILCVPLGVVFARLYYVAFNFAAYRSDPVRILYVWEGGLAIYGAIIGGLIGLLVYSRIKKIPLLTLLDVCAPGLVLAQAIGRWGNFFNQEAFGPAVTNPSHMWFPLAVKIDATQSIHYATFFYESLWCLLIFLFLWFFLRKRAKHRGDVFLWYALLYAFERMFVEQLRTDSLYLAGSIRISQLLSAIVFAGVAIFMIVRAVREKKLGHLIGAEAPEEAEPIAETETDGGDASDDAPCDNGTEAEKASEDPAGDGSEPGGNDEKKES